MFPISMPDFLIMFQGVQSGKGVFILNVRLINGEMNLFNDNLMLNPFWDTMRPIKYITRRWQFVDFASIWYN